MPDGCHLASEGRARHSLRMTHPIIEIFEQRAAMLDMQASNAGLDDAIAGLAVWMDLARDHLKEEDWVVLGEIGGMLYREGASRRRT